MSLATFDLGATTFEITSIYPYSEYVPVGSPQEGEVYYGYLHYRTLEDLAEFLGTDEDLADLPPKGKVYVRVLVSDSASLLDPSTWEVSLEPEDVEE